MTDSVIETGKAVPDFELPATGGEPIRLSRLLAAGPVVIYFYPKDDTAGCTTEGKDFTARHEDFRAAGVAVIGISRDALKSHEKFKAKHGFPFELLADESEAVCELFGVMKLKNMYGKQVRGIERSTFLIDRDGILRREWRKVKVAGHVDEVLEAIDAL
ncbi:peroxiredoxin [Ectothiorhodospira lacustris]|uniref:peroxiredoxin n=1 Tax=Ectothiorhodospira lacustris TaxID=2899127 RepID=UPI001EE90DE9|nr:peroxiredoxin [Ectothiorhodospira lacustris]MCG5511275.1 peroxiredoxin [Ectothiorhodospira lacustris]MCG5523003.1 peroxiredoxin [Ectothiorhodospira lacustris]